MLNHIDLMGRLTDAPQRKGKGEGQTVVTFSLACQRSHADKNGKHGTDFFDIAVFGALADFAERYFCKGQLVVAEGRLVLREWQDTEGCKRKQINIVAERLHFAGRKPKAAADEEPGAREREPGGDSGLPEYDYAYPNDNYDVSFL